MYHYLVLLEPTAEAMRSYQVSGGTTNVKVVANVLSLLAEKPSLLTTPIHSLTEDKPGNEYCTNTAKV
jgi:hypothetical protein